jgi:hypothetical protein
MNHLMMIGHQEQAQQHLVEACWGVVWAMWNTLGRGNFIWTLQTKESLRTTESGSLYKAEGRPWHDTAKHCIV